MRNKKYFLRILGLLAIFGFAGFVYAQSDGGTFTLTDIPSEYNGMYAFFSADYIYPEISPGVGGGRANLWGCQSLSIVETKFAAILNGRVSMPLWLYDTHGPAIARYFGNDTISAVKVYIFDSETFPDGYYESAIAEIEFRAVSFSNGGATLSFLNNAGFRRR